MQQQKQLMSSEGEKAIIDFFEKETYTVKAAITNFSSWVRASFNAFSPKALGIPADMYVKILSVRGNEYSFNNMHTILQVLVQTSGKAMDMKVDEYAVFINEVDKVSKDYLEQRNSYIQDFAAKYPAPEPEKDENAIEIEDVPKKAKEIPMPTAQA